MCCDIIYYVTLKKLYILMRVWGWMRKMSCYYYENSFDLADLLKRQQQFPGASRPCRLRTAAVDTNTQWCAHPFLKKVTLSCFILFSPDFRPCLFCFVLSFLCYLITVGWQSTFKNKIWNTGWTLSLGKEFSTSDFILEHWLSSLLGAMIIFLKANIL